MRRFRFLLLIGLVPIVLAVASPETPKSDYNPPLAKASDEAEKAKKIAFTAIAGGLVLIVILAHFLWTPLDILWFKGLRKVDTAISG